MAADSRADQRARANAGAPHLPAAATSRLLPEIEALRGIAILMVLAEHLPFNLFAWNGWWLQTSMAWWRGMSGVDLFFAVSGFVIARGLLPQLAQAKQTGRVRATLAAFWVRRAFRLLPAAWAWIAISLAVTLLANGTGVFGRWAANLPAAIAALLNLANMYNGLFFYMAANPHLGLGLTSHYWSLSAEEQFYLALPLIALASGRFLALPLLLAFAGQWLLPPTLQGIFRPGGLAAGVLIAMWHARQPKPAMSKPHAAWLAWLLLAAGIWLCGFLISARVVGVPLVFSTSPPNALFGPAWGMLALVCGGMVHLAARDQGRLVPPGKLRTALAWIGSRSYAIYLCHPVCFNGTRGLFLTNFGPFFGRAAWAGPALLVVAAILTLLAAEATHRLIEQPLRRRGQVLAARINAGR